MANRTLHVSLDVEGALLNWTLRDFGKLLRDSEGRRVPGREAKAWLLGQLAEGRKVIPFGEPCEGYDYSGRGCPGHDATPP